MEARDLRGGDRPGHAEETFGPLTASRSATANKCLMSRSFTMLRLLAAVLLLACARQPSPEEVALEYGRALYANDRAAAYRLLSSDDRRLKDEEVFRAQAGEVTGFALEASRRLAAFMVATSVERTVAGARVTIKLKLKMPDANAPDVQTVVGEWDERRLNALPQAERMRIMEKLQGLGTVGRLPMVEGEETFELVKEAAGWRVSLNLAGGVRVQFHARASKSLALGLNVSPEEARVVPGDRVRVTVRATNLSGQPVRARVSHRVEPETRADSLALLQCPLFLPVTLSAGQSQEFVSEYLVLKDVPEDAKQFRVTYEFLPAEQGR